MIILRKLIVFCFSNYGYTNNIKYKVYKYDKKELLDNISYKFTSRNKAVEIFSKFPKLLFLEFLTFYKSYILLLCLSIFL